MDRNRPKTPSSENAAPPRANPLLRRRAARARNIADLRSAARRRLPRGIFDFMDGGAEDEVTLTANASAYAGRSLMPKVLVDVSNIVMTSKILGESSALPFAIGPTGGVGFLWPRGDIALAKVAEAVGIPFTLSTTAAVSIEDLRERSAGRLWLQSYIFRQRAFTEKLIRRAIAAEYEALVITVDLPVGGNRERDFRNDFSVPFRYTARNMLDFALHPEWIATTLRNGMPRFGNLVDFVPSDNASDAASSVGRNYDSSFDWDDLKGIRDLWPGKLIVKGVVRPDDAERLVSLGADAIVVSNHGGRQLDGAPATLDALAGVKAAAGTTPVFLDGGIRRGSDVFKAIASGADCVMIGRATMYGVAAAGEDGVARAVEILSQELKRTMQLCGATRITDIDGGLLADPKTTGG